MTIVLWGTPKLAKDWEEEVIAESSDVEHIAKAKEWATNNGYRNLREMKLDGEKPNFEGTINIK